MAERPKRSRLRKVMRVLFIAGGGLLILAVLALAGARLYFNDARLRQLALKIAGDALGDPGILAIDDLHLRLFQGLELQGLTVRNSNEPESPVLSVKAVRVKYQLGGLLARRFIISEISVENPEVRLTQENGRWNYEALLPVTSGTPPASQSPASSGPISIPVSIKVKNLHIQHAGLNVEMDGGIRVEVKNADLALSASVDAGTAMLRLDQSFKSERLKVSVPPLPGFELPLEQKLGLSVNLATGEVKKLEQGLRVSSFLKQEMTATARHFGEQDIDINQFNMDLDLNGLARELAPVVGTFVKGFATSGKVEVTLQAGGALKNLEGKPGSIRVTGNVHVSDPSLSLAAPQLSAKDIEAGIGLSFAIEMDHPFPRDVKVDVDAKTGSLQAVGMASVKSSETKVAVAAPDIEKDSLTAKWDHRSHGVVLQSPPLVTGPLDLSASGEVKSQNLDALSRGDLQVLGTKLGIADILNATLAGSVKQWAEKFFFEVFLDRLNVGAVSRLGVKELSPALASLQTRGQINGRVQLSGVLPNAEQIEKLTFPIKIDAHIKGNGIGADVDEVQCWVQALDLHLHHEANQEVQGELGVTGFEAVYKSSLQPGAGGAAGKQSAQLSILAKAAGDIALSLKGKAPTARQLDSLEFPLEARLKVQVATNASFGDLSPEIEKARASERISITMDLGAPGEGKGVQVAGIRVAGQGPRLSIQKKKEGPEVSGVAPPWSISVPLSVHLALGDVKTIGPGLDARFGEIAHGKADLSLRHFGEKGLTYGESASVSLSRLASCFRPVLESLLGKPFDAQGTLSWEAYASGQVPGPKNQTVEPLKAKALLRTDIQALTIGPMLNLNAREPVSLRSEINGQFDLKKKEGTGRLVASFSGKDLSLAGMQPLSLGSVTGHVTSEGRYTPEHQFPFLNLKGGLSFQNLVLPSLVSLASGILKFEAQSTRETPESIRAGFTADLKDVEYLDESLGLHPLQVRVSGSDTAVNLSNGLVHTRVSAIADELGQDFSFSLSASLREWGNSFDAKGTLAGLNLEAVTEWLPGQLLGQGKEQDEPPLSAEGMVSADFTLAGSLPSDGELEELKLPVELAAVIRLKDVGASYYEEVPAPEGNTTEEEEPPALEAGAEKLNGRIRITHRVSSGRVSIRSEEMGHAEFYYSDPSLGEVSLPLSTGFEILVENLANPQVLIRDLHFQLGQLVSFSARGSTDLATLATTTLTSSTRVDLAQLADALPDKLAEELESSVGLPEITGTVDVKTEVLPGAGKGVAGFLEVKNVLTTDIEELTLGKEVATDAIHSKLDLSTSFNPVQYRLGRLRLRGALTIEAPAFADEMIYSSSIPLEIKNIEIDADTFSELVGELAVTFKGLACDIDLGGKAVSTPENDVVVGLDPVLDLISGGLELAKASFRCGDWLRINSIAVSVKEWGKSISLKLDRVSLGLGKLIQQAAEALAETGYLPMGLETEGGNARVSLDIKAAEPGKDEGSFSPLVQVLEGLLGDLPPLVPAGSRFTFQMPRLKVGSEAEGLEIDIRDLSGATSLANDTLHLSGKLGRAQLQYLPLLGEAFLDPTANLQLDLENFDHLVLKGNLDTPFMGMTSSLDLSADGLLALFKARPPALSPAGLLRHVRSKLQTQFRLVLTDEKEVMSGLTVRGSLGGGARYYLRPGKFLQLSGFLEINGFEAKYAEEIEIQGLQGRIPFRKTYLIKDLKDGKSAEPVATVGLSQRVMQKSSSERGATGGPLPSFMAELRPYGPSKRALELKRVRYKGRTILEDLAATLEFDEGRLNVEQFRLKMLGGDIMGTMRVRSEGGAQRLVFQMEFAGIGASGASKKKKGKEKKGINGDVRLALSLARAGEPGGLTDIEGAVNLTRISSRALLALLDAADPLQSDPSISQLRMVLSLGSPKLVKMNFRHGNMALSVSVKAAIATYQQDIPKIPISRLIHSRSLQKSLAALSEVQALLGQLAAPAIEITPRGSIQFAEK